MEFMHYVERYENASGFSLNADYEAIRWLQDHVEGTPVVLEAQTVEYNWGSRISIYTGFPTVVGWNWHQRQQRGWEAEQVQNRVNDVLFIYNTPDIDTTLVFLEKYGVNLIMVGDLEHAYYDPLGLTKFDRMVDQGYLRLIYERGSTRIYEVIRTQGGIS
jgi:uncharacterized membrane protein